jgi:transcriptional regulator with GAF, ATPase, and Fis domain
MESREFHSDLYYRLNVFPIRIPPLRERPEDILLLVRYFTQKYCRRMQRQIESIEANERDEIVRILKGTNGRVAGPDGAAAHMDIKRATLISRMEKLGIRAAKSIVTPIKQVVSVPPTGSYCFLEPWILELPPMPNRRQCRDRLRHFLKPLRLRTYLPH